MVKRYSVSFVLCLSVMAVFSTLQGQDILKILEGYGRDSTLAYSADDAQEEAARLFNIILEPDGDIAVQRANQLLAEGHSPVVKSYLCVMLADYAFVNRQDQQGLQYMQRAVKEYDPIRSDSYYKLVFNRAQKNIEESPGKTEEHKTTAIAVFNPEPVKAEVPPVEEKPAVSQPAPETAIKPEAAAPAPVQKTVNYRIQVGAFSVRDNALRKQEFYEKEGYEVQIEERESTYGSLYLIRVGAYEKYDEARDALTRLKEKYPDEEGIVVKTSIK